jgi:hypothetical protein
MTHIAKTVDDVKKAMKVMRELRPDIAESDYVSRVIDQMREGYILAFIEENGEAVSAIGFRYMQMLLHGKKYYIDDLSTLASARGKARRKVGRICGQNGQRRRL